CRAGVCDGHFAEYDSRAAQKNELKPWQHAHWCLPSVGGEFVAAMEDVLDLYEEEYDPRYPTVCPHRETGRAACGCPASGARGTWSACACGLRVRTAWHTQSLRSGRTPGRVAACRGDGPTHHAGLCETRAVAGVRQSIRRLNISGWSRIT